mgnify:CR=1 FL=1
MEATGDIAVIGLAVMGQNLILNMNDHGFTVVAYNRTTSKVDESTKRPCPGTHSSAHGAPFLTVPGRLLKSAAADWGCRTRCRTRRSHPGSPLPHRARHQGEEPDGAGERRRRHKRGRLRGDSRAAREIVDEAPSDVPRPRPAAPGGVSCLQATLSAAVASVKSRCRARRRPVRPPHPDGSAPPRARACAAGHAASGGSPRCRAPRA